jgi:hypothetical protein
MVSAGIAASAEWAGEQYNTNTMQAQFNMTKASSARAWRRQRMALAKYDVKSSMALHPDQVDESLSGARDFGTALVHFSLRPMLPALDDRAAPSPGTAADSSMCREVPIQESARRFLALDQHPNDFLFTLKRNPAIAVRYGATPQSCMGSRTGLKTRGINTTSS